MPFTTEMRHKRLSRKNDALPPRLANLDFIDHPFKIIDHNVFKFGLYAIFSWDNGPITFSNVNINDRPKHMLTYNNEMFPKIHAMAKGCEFLLNNIYIKNPISVWTTFEWKEILRRSNIKMDRSTKGLWLWDHLYKGP